MTAISKPKTTDKTIAINALLISIFAAFNPLLPYAANPIGDWLLSIITAFLFGAVVSWSYAKFRRRPIALVVRSGGLVLAWFFMASTVLLPYMDKAEKQRAPAAVGAPVAAQYSEIDELLKNAPAHQPRSEIEELLKNAPPYQPR